MSKEVVRPEQFGRVEISLEDESLQLSEQQQQELTELYKGTVDRYQQGKLIIGKIISADSDGVLSSPN